MREPSVPARIRSVASSFFGALLLGLALATAPLPARATTLAPLTDDQMTDASDLVVRGTVTALRTELDAKGHVWTVADVTVSRAYKGAAPETVVVRTPGGVTADRVMPVDGMPRFSVDEDVILFLSARNAGDYLAVGGWQGKYTVRPDPVNGAALVQRFTVSSLQPYDARFIPAPPAAQRVLLTSLEASIEHRVEVGWDGTPIPGISAERLRAINHVAPGVK